jgi:HK97 family phage portal protein
METKETSREDVTDYERLMESYNHSAESGIQTKSGIDMLQAQMDGSTGAGVWDDIDMRAFLDATTLKSLFFGEDWVFINVDLIANKISSEYLMVMKREYVNGKELVKPANSHWLQQLIENPNQWQDYHAWMYNAVVDLILMGNVINWYTPSNKQLMVIPAESVSLHFNQEGQLDKYVSNEYSIDGNGMASRGATEFPVEQISHIRRPNPASLLWGLSPFIPGRKSVLFNRYSMDYLNSFYQKGAIPGFALEMDKEANERVALRLLRSFENAYTGRKNMRRTIVLPKGVSVKEMSHTLANQELALYIDKNRETILAILKTPKHEVSLQAAGSLGSEEYKTALKNFWNATLIPTMRLIEGGLTQYFQKELGADHFFAFDLSKVDILQEDQAVKATHGTSLLNIWTLNEVRKTLYDLPPVAGGDVVKGFGDKPAFSPFGLAAQVPLNKDELPQLPESTYGKEIKPVVDAVPTKRKANKEKMGEFLKRNDDWFKKRETSVAKAVDKGTKAMEIGILELFSDMAVEVIKTARRHLKEKGYDGYATKADEQSKVVGKAEMRRRLRKSMDSFEEQYLENNRKALLSIVDIGYDAALSVPFNLPSVNEIEGLRARNAQVRMDALDERSSRAFKYLNETNLEKVFRTIENGIDSGQTVQQITTSLRDNFSDVKEIGSRAQTIARTETLTAVSLGQAAMMDDAKTVIPNLLKMWLSADDDRVRDSHEELHGDVVGVNETFENGLEFPRDPNGAAGEIINCRCTWITLPAEEMTFVDEDRTESEF